MTVPGAQVVAEPIDGGTALVFTTPGDVAELRRRVRTLVRLHNLRVLEKSGTTLIAATDDLPGGARLNIRPLDAARVAAVNDHAAQRAVVLARGACPAVATERLVTWITERDAQRDHTLSRR